MIYKREHTQTQWTDSEICCCFVFFSFQAANCAAIISCGIMSDPFMTNTTIEQIRQFIRLFLALSLPMLADRSIRSIIHTHTTLMLLIRESQNSDFVQAHSACLFHIMFIASTKVKFPFRSYKWAFRVLLCQAMFRLYAFSLNVYLWHNHPKVNWILYAHFCFCKVAFVKTLNTQNLINVTWMK